MSEQPSRSPDAPVAPTDPRKAIVRLNMIGFGVLALLVIVFGGWAVSADIAGAVIGNGTVVVESSVKKIQHPTGGIVGQIFVKEGDSVKPGQILVRLDDTTLRATLGIIQSQLDSLVAREARLQAEIAGDQDIAFPQELTDRATEKSVVKTIAGEENLFRSRRDARKGQREQLRERINQSNEEILGLTAQAKSKESEISFISEELTGVTGLYEKNLVTIVRYNQLKRDKARIEGERGQYVSEMAKTRAKISETELQIIQVEQDFRTEVLKDLRETQAKIAELRERAVAAEDQLKRVDIRSPQAGYVHQLTVHTVGGVVSNGETIMQIIPGADQLIIEARIAPQDIDQVAVGAETKIRILAGNQREMPDSTGTLTYVGADLTKDTQSPQAFYVVRATLPESELKRFHKFKLVPGMPAEIFIRTNDRTPLQYLLKPLNEQIARAFRER
jgi:HlyD family secretion protein